MSYSNKINIYIPFRENNLIENIEILNKIIKYYESNNFNVILLDSLHDNFNIGASKNLAFESNDEIVCIVNADTIINALSIKKSIEYSLNNECTIKPFNRYFLFKNKNDKNFNSLLNNEIVNNFNYDGFKYYYIGAAWVINQNIKNFEKFDENILTSDFNNLDYFLRTSLNSKNVFIEGDCYSFNHTKMGFNTENNLINYNIYNNFFEEKDLNFYVYKNGKEEKLKKNILNEYFKR